jgi:DNA-binding protein YbaB
VIIDITGEQKVKTVTIEDESLLDVSQKEVLE